MSLQRQMSHHCLPAVLFLVAALALAGCGGNAQDNSPQPKTLRQIVVTPTGSTLEIGSTLPLLATGVYSDGSKQDITASVHWATSDSAIVSVTAAGMATAVAAGSAHVSAAANTVSGSSTINVNPPHLVSVNVQPENSSVPVGEATQLTATGTYSDGGTRDVTATVAWNSSGTGIATVSESGMVTGMAVGTATITAVAGTVQGVAVVQVAPAATLSIDVEPKGIAIPIGTIRQAQAVAHLSDGTTQDVTASAAWSSNSPEVLGVDNTGKLVAQQTGSATITATSGSVSGSASFTVTPLMTVNYFDADIATTTGADATMRLSNTGLTGGDLCAMIYVFSADQQLSECCGCLVTPDGLRTLSVANDLTNNPLTGVRPANGVITVVPSQPAADLSCDPTTLTPSGHVVSWATHIQSSTGSTFAVTEGASQTVDLSDAERMSLESQCSFLIRLGSGQGICTCGTGD